MMERKQNIEQPGVQKVKSNCHYCGYLCAFVATVEDGKLVALEPDTTRYPYDDSIVKRCHRWQMNLTEIDGSGRINYPQKRVGPRGSGQWERVTWDEAMSDIAKRMSALVEQYGPGTVASSIGGPHATFWPLHRFMNALGSPNNMGIGQICWNPRIWVQSLTFGWPIESDINVQYTGAIFLWATNPAVSDNSLFWRNIRDIHATGVPLVVIDPRKSATARAADLHLAPFPGSDCTLALGLVHVIIRDNLVDHKFVDRWCHGYEGLVRHVQKYTPQYVESVTGVPAADVECAAHIFGEAKSAALVSGRGIDQLGSNTLPTLRSIAILRAITGNIDTPGACVLNTMSDFIPEVDMEMSYQMPDEVRKLQLNTPYSPLQSFDGWDHTLKLTWQQGKRLPMRYLTSAHPNLVWRAMISGDPYPVRALIVEAANPLVTYANTHLVYEAIQHLDLMVVLEYYMTPTAQLADYVLPSASAFERPLFQAQGGVSNVAYGGGAAVAPYYERRCDYNFFRELGLRLGQDDIWPQETLEEALDVQMSTTNMDWRAFENSGLYYGQTQYHKHEWVLPDTGEPWGFATTTGKVELKCEYLIALGASEYPEPQPLDDAVDLAFGEELGLGNTQAEVVGAAGSAPQLLAEDSAQLDESNPHVMRMITGARTPYYWASSYFNNEEFRRKHPYPHASMSKATLDAAGLQAGQWVYVRTSKGRARFMTAVEDIVDGVVSVEYGWWYPEVDACEPKLSGVWESNVNLLTSGDIETSEELIGSWKYNGILCIVEPCEEQAE